MDSNHRCLDVGQESSPLDHGIVAVAGVGVEPTVNHQALDLAALPVCVPCRPAPPTGLEPVVSTLTEWRGLHAPPRGRLPAEAVGLEPTSGCAATCFRNKLLIRPDGFRRWRLGPEGLEPSRRWLRAR